MTITQAGPVCDVGGEFILMPALGFGQMHAFSMTVLPGQTLHVCDDHKPALVDASDKNDWTVLPDGPLRRAFEEAAARIESEAPHA